jgi:hypothetical protein
VGDILLEVDMLEHIHHRVPPVFLSQLMVEVVMEEKVLVMELME